MVGPYAAAAWIGKLASLRLCAHHCDMHDMLAELAARLRRLEDLEAIRAVVASYGPLVDTGDGTAVAELWRPDGVYDVAGNGTWSGRTEIATLVDIAEHQELMNQGCGHVLSPIAIDLTCDRATARGYSMVLRNVGTAQVPCFEVYRLAANRWLLERGEDGAWCVVHRDNALLNGEEAARAILTPPTGPHRP